MAYDLFIEAVAGPPPTKQPTDARWLTLCTSSGCCVARYAGALQPLVNGLSTGVGLVKSRDLRSDAQMLAPETEIKKVIDLQTWMINSTEQRYDFLS